MANNSSLTLYNRTSNDLLYDYALSSAYRTAWVYDPSLALKNDADVYEKVRNDAAFTSSMDRSTRSIVKPWRVEASKTEKDKKGKQLAAICEEGLSDIYRFNASRRRLAEARFLGRTYGYIESEIRACSLDGTAEMDWIIPRRIVDIDRRRLRWISDGGAMYQGRRTQSTKLGFFNTVSNMWEDLSPEFRMAIIEYTVLDTEDRVGYGRGLLEPIYFAHYCKSNTILKIDQGIDRWANGIMMVKLDSLRNSSTSKTNEDLRAAAQRAAQIARTNHVWVLQDGDTVESLETSGSGNSIAMEAIHYWDDVVERLCNGSTRPSGQGGSKSGARAQAETEEDTSESFFQDEREDLDAVLDNHLVGFFLRANAGNLMRLGMLPGRDCKRPRFTSEQIKREDPLTAVQVAAQLKQIGFDLSKAELSEKSGYSIPDPDEEMIQGTSMEMEAATNGLQIDGKGKPKPFESLDDAEKGNAKKYSEKFEQMAERFEERIRRVYPVSQPVPATPQEMHLHLSEAVSQGVLAPGLAKFSEGVLATLNTEVPKIIKQEMDKMNVTINVPPASPTPIVVENTIKVAPTPVTVEPTPIKIDNQVNVSPTPITIQNDQAAPIVNVTPEVTLGDDGKKKHKDVKIKRDGNGNISGLEIDERRE